MLLKMPRIVSKSDLIPGLIEDVDIFKIKPPKIPLRARLTDIKQLALSIRTKGLLQPIVVRPDNDGFFEIVAGNRRFTACKLLHWRKIPCHIVEIDEREAFEISLIENVQRKTLSPVEEAEAFKKYVSDFGWGGVSDLAVRIGRSATYVTRRICLLDLPHNILESIEKSVINVSVAQELCAVTDKSSQMKLTELISKRHVSLRSIRSIIKNEIVDSDTTISQSSAVNSLVEEDMRAFDKAIIILRACVSKLGSIINHIEGDWPASEILMQHKSMLDSQIDLLLKQRKKLLSCGI